MASYEFDGQSKQGENGKWYVEVTCGPQRWRSPDFDTEEQADVALIQSVEHAVDELRKKHPDLEVTMRRLNGEKVEEA